MFDKFSVMFCMICLLVLLFFIAAFVIAWRIITIIYKEFQYDRQKSEEFFDSDFWSVNEWGNERLTL